MKFVEKKIKHTTHQPTKQMLSQERIYKIEIMTFLTENHTRHKKLSVIHKIYKYICIYLCLTCIQYITLINMLYTYM